MLLARVAQYWLMDFYSRVFDQRMSIIGKMRNRIILGQARQISDNLNKHEEQDRHAARYSDEPKKESYLPSSVHGSPRHMAALAKKSLVLVSDLDARIYS
jgi:phosphoribosylformylglycinamidine (FGAM) synthase-like amidotransferase family enzyme